MNSDTEYYQPVTPLPYSRIEPWSLAPWLTGIIVALVIFVILIPALCSACYHYYSYKLGLDEDLDQEEYLEEDEEEDSEEDESDDEENDEKLETSLPKSGGSIITCCPRLVLPTGSVMPSCQLDQDLPRLPCGHFGVPTRDVGIQVPQVFHENIYDEEGGPPPASRSQSSSPEDTTGQEESDTTIACSSMQQQPRISSTVASVTWKNLLSPSTESSSSITDHHHRHGAGQELLIGGGLRNSTKCFRCGGYELNRQPHIISSMRTLRATPPAAIHNHQPSTMTSCHFHPDQNQML